MALVLQNASARRAWAVGCEQLPSWPVRGMIRKAGSMRSSNTIRTHVSFDGTCETALPFGIPGLHAQYTGGLWLRVLVVHITWRRHRPKGEFLAEIVEPWRSLLYMSICTARRLQSVPGTGGCEANRLQIRSLPPSLNSKGSVLAHRATAFTTLLIESRLTCYETVSLPCGDCIVQRAILTTPQLILCHVAPDTSYEQPVQFLPGSLLSRLAIRSS